ANAEYQLPPRHANTRTLINSDVAPTLTVIKHVVNDNLGTATASQWTMHIKSGGTDVSGKSPFAGAESPGTTKTLNSGSYVVSESSEPRRVGQSVRGGGAANGD